MSGVSINVSTERVHEIESGQLLSMVGQLTKEVAKLTAVNEALSARLAEQERGEKGVGIPTVPDRVVGRSSSEGSGPSDD